MKSNENAGQCFTFQEVEEIDVDLSFKNPFFSIVLLLISGMGQNDAFIQFSLDDLKILSKN